MIAAKRHAATERLGGEDEIGLDTEMCTGKKFAGAAKAGLHFIGDKDDAALAADLRQRRQKSGRRHDKATFPKHRLNHNRCNGLGCHHAAKGLIEQLVDLPCGHRSAVGEPRIGGHAERDAINIGQEGAETFLVGMSLAGERQAHHGAAVKAIFHREDRGAAGKGARNLHRVLHRFRAAVHQESLLGKVTRA